MMHEREHVAKIQPRANLTPKLLHPGVGYDTDYDYNSV